jgi:hypothetical protein
MITEFGMTSGQSTAVNTGIGLAILLSLAVKSLPKADATVAAVCDWVALMALRTPRAGVSGPRTAIHV